MTKEERKEYQKQYYLKHKEYYKQKRDNKKEVIYAKKYADKFNENIVYKYIQLDTNELAYIGSTGNIYKRLKQRNCSYKSNTYFDKFYRENKENYKFEIIQKTETREQAYKIEKELIKKLKPKYNIANK